MSHALELCNLAAQLQGQSRHSKSRPIPCAAGCMKIGWVWKRAKLAAKDDDPQRVEKLARIRWIFEHLSPKQLLLFADELDIHLLPKVGYQWMEKGRQLEVLTPGTNEKNYLAGALDIADRPSVALRLVSQDKRAVHRSAQGH